jgi:hypothetical protein
MALPAASCHFRAPVYQKPSGPGAAVSIEDGFAVFLNASRRDAVRMSSTVSEGRQSFTRSAGKTLSPPPPRRRGEGFPP